MYGRKSSGNGRKATWNSSGVGIDSTYLQLH